MHTMLDMRYIFFLCSILYTKFISSCFCAALSTAYRNLVCSTSASRIILSNRRVVSNKNEVTTHARRSATTITRSNERQ